MSHEIWSIFRLTNNINVFIAFRKVNLNLRYEITNSFFIGKNKYQFFPFFFHFRFSLSLVNRIASFYVVHLIKGQVCYFCGT